MKGVFITFRGKPSRLLNKLFGGRVLRYVAWLSYEHGFTGRGPTPFDKPPPFKKPWLPRKWRISLDSMFEEVAAFRRQAWDGAVREVTGEDPEDWL